MKNGPNASLFMILAGAAFVFGTGAVFFQYNSLSGQKAAAAELRQKIRDEGATKLQLEEGSKKLQESTDRLRHLEEGLPDLAYIPTMLTELERVGRESGIVVLGIRPMPKPAEPPKKDGSAPKKKDYQELGIEVKGRGQYSAVATFLETLQQFPKIVAVRTVTLQPKRDLSTPNGGPPVLDVTVEIRAFVFSNPIQKPEESGTPTAKADRRDVADKMVGEQKP